MNKNNKPINNQLDTNNLANYYNLQMHVLCKECTNKCKQYYGNNLPLKLTCSKYIKQKAVFSNGGK